MNLENLQLAETPGASPEDHLSGRFKVPDGYALIKQEPDAELLERMRNFINNFLDNENFGVLPTLAIYKFISGYAPKHNQD